MIQRTDNVLLRISADALIAAARGLPDPSESKETVLEAETFDESGRRVRVRYYKLTLHAHLNTWHLWCPDSAWIFEQ